MIDDLQDSDSTMIKAWSHSRDANFRTCNLRAKLLYIDKLKEPRPPLKEGQTEYANDRGTRIHEASELYVKGGVELIGELEKFRPEYERTRQLYSEGKVSIEGEWAFNDAWQPVAYMSPDVWVRIKLDFMIRPEPKWAVVVDLKSGRRSGNELKHAEQTQLYAVATLLKYPQIERITTELWYCDVDDLARTEYTREQAMRFFKIWNERGLAITSATTFPPNANKFSCRFCHFGPKGSGVCTVGV